MDPMGNGLKPPIPTIFDLFFSIGIALNTNCIEPSLENIIYVGTGFAGRYLVSFQQVWKKTHGSERHLLVWSYTPTCEHGTERAWSFGWKMTFLLRMDGFYRIQTSTQFMVDVPFSHSLGIFFGRGTVLIGWWLQGTWLCFNLSKLWRNPQADMGDLRQWHQLEDGRNVLRRCGVFQVSWI